MALHDQRQPTWRVCGVPGLREEEWSEGGERAPRPLLGGDRMPLPRPPTEGGDTTLPLPRPTEAGDRALACGDTRGVHKYSDTNKTTTSLNILRLFDPFNKINVFCYFIHLISFDAIYGQFL